MLNVRSRVIAGRGSINGVAFCIATKSVIASLALSELPCEIAANGTAYSLFRTATSSTDPAVPVNVGK